MAIAEEPERIDPTEVKDLSELVRADYKRIDNPLAEPTWTATLVCLIGIAGFFYWVNWALQGYLAYEKGDSALPNTSIIDVGIPIFLGSIAIELTISLLSGKEYYRLNDTVTAFSNGLFQQLFVITTTMLGEYVGLPLITAIPYAYIYEHYRILDLSGWQGFLVMFFARDFCYYWFHRAAHRIAFLWAVHAVHHQPNEFNYSVNVSQGALQRVTSALFYAPLALFMNPALYLVLFPMEKVFGFLTHTKLVNKTMGLEYFFVTPSSHRVHHAGAPSKYIDKNYGEMLTIWDHLFGTFQEEEEPVVYGHVHPLDTFNPVRAQTRVWQEIASKAQTCASWKDKLLCFIMPPGWDPVSRGEYPLVDSHPYQALKYDSDLNGMMSIYVLCHFLVTLVSGIYLLQNFRSFGSVVQLYCGILYCAMSLTSYGLMYDRSSHSISFETCRLLITIPITLYVLPVSIWGTSPYVMQGIVSVVVVSLVTLLLNQELFSWHEVESDMERQERVWIFEHGRRFTEKYRAQQAMVRSIPSSIGDGEELARKGRGRSSVRGKSPVAVERKSRGSSPAKKPASGEKSPLVALRRSSRLVK